MGLLTGSFLPAWALPSPQNDELLPGVISSGLGQREVVRMSAPEARMSVRSSNFHAMPGNELLLLLHRPHA